MATPAPVNIFTTPAYKAMTPTQQRAAITKILSTWGGTVTAAWVKENPSLKPLQGKTAVQVFNALVAANPKASYEDVTQGVLEIWLGGNLSGVILDLVNNLGGATAATETGIDTTSLNPIGSVTGFLTALSSANTWIRVAKVMIGGIILIVGLAKLTGADQKAGSIAAKAVKAAPLL